MRLLQPCTTPHWIFGALFILSLLPFATSFLPQSPVCGRSYFVDVHAAVLPQRVMRLAGEPYRNVGLRAKSKATEDSQGGSASPSGPVQEPMPGKLEEKVLRVVDAMLAIGEPARMYIAPKGDLPLDLVTSTADALMNDDAYTRAIYRRAREAKGTKDEQALEEVDEILREMIEKLHMARRRKVLEFVVAAAIAGPEALDNACFELVEKGAIDKRLGELVEFKLQDAKRSAGGPLEAEQSTTVRVLEVVQNRVLAELAAADKPMVKILATLQRLGTREERLDLLVATIESLEVAKELEAAALDGVHYLETNAQGWRLDARVERLKTLAAEIREHRCNLT